MSTTFKLQGVDYPLLTWGELTLRRQQAFAAVPEPPYERGWVGVFRRSGKRACRRKLAALYPDLPMESLPLRKAPRLYVATLRRIDETQPATAETTGAEQQSEASGGADVLHSDLAETLGYLQKFYRGSVTDWLDCPFWLLHGLTKTAEKIVAEQEQAMSKSGASGDRQKTTVPGSAMMLG